jgi:hypothetical protein
VEALRAELSDGEAQLKWLQEKLEDLDLQKREAMAAIDEASRIMDIEKNSTTAEIFRLKGNSFPLFIFKAFVECKTIRGAGRPRRVAHVANYKGRPDPVRIYIPGVLPSFDTMRQVQAHQEQDRCHKSCGLPA